MVILIFQLHKIVYIKAYKALLTHTKSKPLKQFFAYHSIQVDKQIPTMAGLGGGSSNAGVFLSAINEKLALGLSIQQLSNIGLKIGSDVVFFFISL